jgi:TetR/AcrR family transcriptional repressor of nem operon
VTKASLHYHFPSKADLGKRLIERYETTFLAALRAIETGGAAPREQLKRYARIYADVLRDDRMCLCGMLASDYATLPKAMKEEVRHFFDTNEQWLATVLEQGRKAGSLGFKGPAVELARVIVGSLEGAMMLARSFGDASRFDTAAERLIASL